MPGEAIIGKVAVKVIPDTKNFKKELEAQLKKIEKEVKDFKVTITPKLNDADVKAQARKAREVAQAEMKDLKLGVDLDNQDSIKRALATLESQLAKLRESTQLKIGFNEHDIREAMDKLNTRLDEIKHIDLHVDEFNDDSVKRALSQIEAEYNKLSERKIEVHLDEESLFKERQRLQKILDERLQIRAELAEETKAKLRADSQATLDYVQATMRDLKVGAQLDPLEREKLKREIELALFSLSDLHAKIGAELDPIAKRKLELEINALKDRISGLKVKLNPELDNKSVVDTEASLKFLARDRKVNIKAAIDNKAALTTLAVLDRLSGFRQGRGFLDGIKDFLFNLDVALPKISAVGVGIAGIAGGALNASANLFLLAQSLAQIGGGAVALPGVFAGLAIGVVASAVALKDFNSQFADFQIGLGKKTTAGAAWKQLQDMMSEKFWARAKKPIGELITEIFPKLSDGLTMISSSLGLWWGALATGLKNALGPRMAGMFDNLDKSILIATGSTSSLANAVGILGDVGAKQLPRLAAWFTDVATKVSNWLTEAEKTGRLQQLIDRAVTALKALWSIGVSVFGIFNGIADAAKRGLGKDGLTSLADGLERVKKIVQGNVFQKEMSEVFRSTAEALHEIAVHSGPAVAKFFKNLGDTLSGILPQVGATIGELAGGLADAFNQPRVLGGIKVFFGSIQDFATGLRPAFKPVGDAVGAVLDVMSSFIVASGPTAASALSTISEMVTTLSDGIRPFIEEFVPAVGNLFDKIQPGIQKVVDAVSNFFSGEGGKAITKFVEDITPGVEKLANFFGDVGKAIMDWLGANAGDILDTWSNWFNDFSDWVDKHKDDIIQFLNVVLDVIKGLATNLPLVVTALTALIALKLVKLASDLADVAKSLGLMAANGERLGAIKWLVIAAGILALTSAMNSTGEKVKNKPGPNNLDELIFGEGGWEGLKKKLDNFWDKIKGIFKWIDDHTGIGGPLGLLWDMAFGDGPGKADKSGGGGKAGGAPGTAPKTNWPNGVPPWEQDQNGQGTGGDAIGLGPNLAHAFDDADSIFNDRSTKLNGKFASWFSGLTGSMPGWLAPVPTIFGTTLDNVSTSLGGFIPGFGSLWGDLWGQADTKTGEGKTNVLGGLGGLLSSITTNVGGFIPGFGGLFSSLWGTANSQTKTGTDKTNTTTRGGMSDMLQSVIGGIPGITTEFKNMPGKITSALGDLSSLLTGPAGKVIQGFIDGIQSKFRDVKTVLGNLTSLLPSWKGPASTDATILFNAGQLVIGGFINGLESKYGDVRDSLSTLTKDALTSGALNNSLIAAANGNVEGGLSVQQKVLIYNAAPGSSLSSEEDLFAAASRTRLGW
jgi:phage-related protein